MAKSDSQQTTPTKANDHKVSTASRNAPDDNKPTSPVGSGVPPHLSTKQRVVSFL